VVIGIQWIATEPQGHKEISDSNSPFESYPHNLAKSLKNRLETAARDAGLVTKSVAPEGARFHVLNRIAVEELEAWFFGDIQAIHQAYEKIPLTLCTKSAYRDPDAIKGGTWEAMERELQRFGYFRSGLAKIKTARAISANMEPSRNRSRSFQAFQQGLNDILRQC
jgi:hypothetical protein